MTTWEDVVCKAKDVAEAASKKTTDVVDQAKMKLKIAENERTISATLEALGRLVYDSHKAETALDENTTGELMTQVDDLTAQNTELQDQLDSYKGQKRCRDCGAVNTEDSAFCKKCGKALD